MRELLLIPYAELRMKNEPRLQWQKNVFTEAARSLAGFCPRVLRHPTPRTDTLPAEGPAEIPCTHLAVLHPTA